MSTYKKDLIQAGEFARISRTTKRTILFYDEIGILKPIFVDKTGYRYYRQEQVMDFQTISLLKHLGLPLEEIKQILKNKYSLKEIFAMKKSEIENKIQEFSKQLDEINTYYKNLDQSENMINAEIKKVKAFEIYYIVRTGPYSKIKDYCFELKNYFSNIPTNSTFLTIFLDSGFTPAKSRMMIGVIKNNQMKLSERGKEIVESDKIASYKALSYIFSGPGSLLSLHWDYLNAFKKKTGYKKDKRIPYGIEFYLKTSLNGEENEQNHIFDIQIPIIEN